MSKFNVGDKVRYIGKGYRETPEFYPEIGTIGVIKSIIKPNAWVRWPDGSTSGNDCWCCPLDSIERIVENMTNEEIWGMLRPKMEKNKLEPMGTCTKWKWCVPEYFYTYSEDDVHSAIALAYKVGYLRAIKGRPFKIGEKNGGHWEPVDIKDVIKGEYKIIEDCLGWRCEYLGTYKKGEDGRFYQWVEDDE